MNDEEITKIGERRLSEIDQSMIGLCDELMIQFQKLKDLIIVKDTSIHDIIDKSMEISGDFESFLDYTVRYEEIQSLISKLTEDDNETEDNGS